MALILIADKISDEGLRLLKTEHQVKIATGLSESELVAEMSGVVGLIVRSQTEVTRTIIEAGESLQVIARAGVGIDNVDVEAATEHGIVVVNSPFANTISTAEHAFALLLASARNVALAHQSLQSGEWERSKYAGVEISEKTLGIVGLGRIGTEVATRAIAFGMRVIAYDPFVSKDKALELRVELCSLQDLFERSDFVTLHTALHDETEHIINTEVLKHAKPGLRIVNAARGALIDEQALIDALDSNILEHAALDVFSEEPATGNPLSIHSKTTVTPHLAASTDEAQVRAAVSVAKQVISILDGAVPEFPVNIETVDPDTMTKLSPYLAVCRAAGNIATQLALGPESDGNIEKAHITYKGNFNNLETHPLRSSAIIGMLGPVTSGQVNIVNASAVADATGLAVHEIKSEPVEPYENLVEITLFTDKTTETISVTNAGIGLEIVSVGDWNIDFRPIGSVLLFVENLDQPGEVGRVGQIMGELGVNISSMSVAPGHSHDSKALMVIGVDRPLTSDEITKVALVEGISRVRQVTL